jgi:GNAT superfamily N-acetyltransferase
MMTAEIEICRVGVEKILDLRHRILRAGMPPESARFEGDEADTTLHLAAYGLGASGRADGQAIGCLSLMLNSFEGESAWQLRGMAVEEGLQQRGLGRQLLTQAEAAAESEDRARLLWCNARVPAAGFYQKHGWAIVSEVFEIPTAGPHVKMSKRLSSVNPRSIVEKPHSKR